MDELEIWLQNWLILPVQIVALACSQNRIAHDRQEEHFHQFCLELLRTYFDLEFLHCLFHLQEVPRMSRIRFQLKVRERIQAQAQFLLTHPPADETESFHAALACWPL